MRVGRADFDSDLASTRSGSHCCGLSEGAGVTSGFAPGLLGDFNKMCYNCLCAAKSEHKPFFFIVPGDKGLPESFALSTTACR